MKKRFLKTINKKLNLGAGAGWKKDGWEVFDHSILVSPWRSRSQAWELPYQDKAFDMVFCSHMFEHISHFMIENVISEINRVMREDGILRVLTPDLKKIASAYVNNDFKTMKLYIDEDTSGIKADFGLGQAFMNFLLSSGSDNYMLSSDFSTICGGYAHVYCYDFDLLSGLLKNYGFHKIRQCSIDDSDIPQHKELRLGNYNKDVFHSLIIECRKKEFVNFNLEKAILHTGPYKFEHILPRPWLLFLFKSIGRIYNFYAYLSLKIPVRLKRMIKKNKTE